MHTALHFREATPDDFPAIRQMAEVAGAAGDFPIGHGYYMNDYIMTKHV